MFAYALWEAARDKPPGGLRARKLGWFSVRLPAQAGIQCGSLLQGWSVFALTILREQT